MAETKRKVFIVSDGTGRTCEQMVRSALVQFDDGLVDLIMRPGTRRPKQVLDIVEEAAREKGIIFFTLVSSKARVAMKDAGQEHFVETVDLLGPVLSGLNSVMNRPPRAAPGLYYESERQYFERVDAIDYTLKHDDGQRLHELGRADVVLVGVSRASKSSTCFYLAYRGIFAANVPLLADREPPKELVRVDKRRVVGLGINCVRLAAMRLARAHAMGTPDLGAYVGRKAIAAEVQSANDQMTRHGWTRIDVSHLAIEEIAREVRRHLDESGIKKRRRRRRTGPRHGHQPGGGTHLSG